MYGGDRRSQDGSGGSGFFGVASPPNSSNNRARPSSAGTQLRQKPPAPSHQDLFASLGIDAHAGGRSSFFGNRGSTASRSSTTAPPPTVNTPNVPLTRYGVPPQAAFATPPPAATNAENWSGSTSRFASSSIPSSAASSSFRAPPVSSTFAAPTTVASGKPSSSLFSMEDTDAFEMDDGWGCDSPSAVLSPSGVLSNPMDEGDVAVDDLNGDDFGWEDEETDKQFGITPPKPAPSPVMPPPGAPVPPPTASFASAAGDSLPSQAHQQSQEESTTTVTKQVPATTSVTETSSMAPLPVAKFGYAERDSWSETWDETESHSDRKDAPAATPGRLRVSATSLTVPAAESIPVANEFWGDQDDGALFDEDEHANDKWDESPAVQDTIADVSKLSLQDEEAAATLETAGAQQHQQSTFAPPPLASEPSPSSFGYSSGAHSYEPQGNVSFHGSNASFDASSEGHSSLPGELHGFGAATPPRAPGAAVSFAADKAESHLSSSSSDHVPSFSAPTAFSDRNEFGHDAPVSAFYGEKPPPVESPSANYFAASPLKDDFASSVADSIAFTQPQSEFHQHSDSGFGNNGYQQHEAQNDNQAAADPQKDWEVPESFGESGGDWGQSLNKDEHFDGDFHQQGGAVQVPPVHLEGESDHHQSGGQQAHSSSAYESSESDAFDYANRSSREETRFYASVRDHEGSSTASVGGDVSSSGATFGGSDYISDGPFSDGNFSETRSMVGSSNASTAFGTDFPSVSEGFSAAATTFGGSDYVSDGQYSDGNVSETPSLNESSNRSAETGSDLPAAGEERYFTETADHADESSPFEKPHSSGGAFNGGFPPAAPAALFNHEHAPSDEANPFASSASGFSASSERSFQPAPFGSAAPDSQSATDPVQESGYVASASSLFGPTAGSDVPNPFGSQPSSSSFVEKELPVADAGDLFGSAPPAAGFGSSFGQPPQQYGEQSYQAYGQGYQQDHGGYYQSNEQAHFGQTQAEYATPPAFGQSSTASAAELFGQSQSSYDGFNSSSAHFGQNDATSSGFGYPQAAENTFASHSQHGAGGSMGSKLDSNQERANVSAFGAHSQHDRSVSDNFREDQSEVASSSPAPSASRAFGDAQARNDAQSYDYTGHHGVESSSSDNSAFSNSYNQHDSAPAFGAVAANTSQEPASAPSFFGHSQYSGPTGHAPTGGYGQPETKALSAAGYSAPQENGQPSASAQGFFGGAPSGNDSFGSTNEFFGGASSSADDFGRGQQTQPSLSRGVSNASSYNEHTANRASADQASYQQPQSWSQSDAHSSTSNSVHGDDSSAPPPPRDFFDKAASSVADSESSSRNQPHPPSYGSEEVARSGQATTNAASYFGPAETSAPSSFPQHSGEAPARMSQSPAPEQGIGTHHQSEFSASYQSNQDSGFSGERSEPAPSLGGTPAAADSSQYFGTAPPQSSEDFGAGYTADPFSGYGSESTLFTGPPPQDQNPAGSSYFGEQSSQPTAYSGFEQPAPTGFAANPSPSDFFSSAPQQKPETPYQSGVSFGENSASYQAPGGHASYQQQQQSFQQQAHSYTDHPAASVVQQLPAQTHTSNFGAQGAPGGYSHQPGGYYDQSAAGGSATASHAPDYSAAVHAHGAGYGAGGHKQAAPVLRSSKYKDPCVPAPSCLASFGFGGNVVTMFPKRKLRLNTAGSSFRNSPRAPVPSHLDNSAHGELRKGPVSVYRMEQLHPKDRHFEQLEKFPGPLTENVSEQVILQYLHDQLKDTAPLTSQQEDERLLLSILSILVKCNGKLRSDPTGNPSDPDSPEVQLVTLLRESDHRRRGNRPALFPPPKPVQTGMHPDLLVKNGNTIRDLLLVGDRKAAVDAAIHAQMWPEAMLIASFTDKDEYKRVLRTYLEGHYSIGDPCRALYMSFADQQEKSVQEPQKLLQTQQQQNSSSILPGWVTHAQVLLANRTGDTNKILIELGDRLWKETDSILAAHVCYLAAGISVEAPSPSSKIALLGADHRTPKEARFYVSSSAVQRTEIYEWIQKRTNANATNMIPFQGYKLIYAMILADHGKLETSFKYVSSMLSVIKAVTASMKPGTSMYLEGMQNQLTVLDDRLRQHLGQHRVNSVASSSSKQGKWGLGSALSIMGKIVTRVVEGSDAPAAASASAPTGAQQGSSLFPGAPRSNNPSATPVYQSSPSPSYPAYAPQGASADSFGAPRSNDAKPTPSYPNTPSQSYPVYGQQGAQSDPRSSDLHATPAYPNTPSQSYPGYGQQDALTGSYGVPRSNDGSTNPAHPSTPSQSHPGYGQQSAQGGAPRSNNANATPAYPSTPSQSYPAYGQHGAQGLQGGPRSNDPSAGPGYPSGPSPSYPAYSQQGVQNAPRSNDSTASRGYPRVPSQSHLGLGQHGVPHSNDFAANSAYPGTPSHSYPGYGQQGLQGAPRSNDPKATPSFHSGPSQSFPGYGQQGAQGAHGGGAYGAHGGSQYGPSSTSSHGTPGPNSVATPSGAYSGPGSNPSTHFPSGPPSQDRYGSPARSMTAPPPSSGSDNGYGLPSTPQGGFPPQPPHPQMTGAFGNQLHFSNSAPNSMPASPSSFQKPTLDLSGDAGKGLAVPARRASEKPRSPTSSSADGPSSAAASGPASDKGSASPKFKDTKKAGRSKTPPPSGSKASSGWFTGISNFIATKVNPEAKVAKLGEQMEAYFDEEKKRWVFPGETATEEAVIPSAPPTGPMPGSMPSSGSGGPPGTHSAPGSISGGSDPLSALMAPPPVRAHAALMKKDPLSAMMAPPARSGLIGQRASSMGNVRKPPRPQFAVFKPAPQASPAPEPTE